MGALNFVVNNYQAIINGLLVTLSGLTAIALVIPGEQPEKTFQALTNFLSKFSKK